MAENKANHPALTGEQQAAAVAAVTPAPEPILGFGPPAFSFPDRVFASKDGKTTTHARYTVAVHGSPFVMEAVIWRTIEKIDGNDCETFSVGLPRGIVLSDTKSDDLRDQADTWRMAVLTAFDKWAEGTGTVAGKPTARRAAPRLVKRLVATAASK